MPDNDQSAGATPAAGGATPPQTPPAQPAATPPAAASPEPTPPTPPATGTGDEPLGPAGMRALEAERAARRDAEAAASKAATELEELRRKSLSDSERAVADAKDAGSKEATEKLHAQIRRSEVKAALAGAGINPSVMDLAVKADEFGKLTISADGEVEGLSEAVKAFKAARPDLFKVDPGDGSADGGARGGGTAPAKTLEEALERQYASQK